MARGSGGSCSRRNRGRHFAAAEHEVRSVSPLTSAPVSVCVMQSVYSAKERINSHPPAAKHFYNPGVGRVEESAGRVTSPIR